MPFSDWKREQRRRLLMSAAHETASLFSADILRRTGISQAILASPRDEVFADLVRAYELEVDGFKHKHGYRPGELINNAKIAGLMLRTLIVFSVNDVFVISPRLHNTGILVEAALVYAWILTCSILRIDRPKLAALAPGYRQDFMAAIWHADDPEPELLCLAMDSLWTAFGDRTVSFED